MCFLNKAHTFTHEFICLWQAAMQSNSQPIGILSTSHTGVALSSKANPPLTTCSPRPWAVYDHKYHCCSLTACYRQEGTGQQLPCLKVSSPHLSISLSIEIMSPVISVQTKLPLSLIQYLHHLLQMWFPCCH